MNLVIITYNPCISDFNNTILSICTQCRNIFIIDNGSNNIFEIENLIKDTPNINLVRLDENKGIAEATNIGMSLSLSTDSNYTVISDQDTIFPSDYVKIAQLTFAKFNKYKIGAICPQFYERNSNYFCRPYTNKNIDTDYDDVYQAIASGLVVSHFAWINTGGMNSDLFIDLVDFEWCWKIESAGFKIIRNNNMVIEHNLGDDSITFLGKNISKHNDIRIYYIVRNTLYLSLYNKNINFCKRINLGLSVVKYLLGFPTISSHKTRTIHYCIKGIKDGLLKKMGKLKNVTH
ncbi:glycosyltransferase [Providencia rettgeri]